MDITGKGGKVSKLKIGDDTPTNSGSYAMLEGDPRVFTVASYVKTGVDKSVNDLRDKRLLTFDQDKLSRVELMAKKQDIEFGRDKDQWQIVKPKPLRADGLQVDEMLRKLKDAKMDLTLSDDDAKKAAAAFASGTPVATVKLTDPSGTQQIEIRKNKDDYYAKSSVVPGRFQSHCRTGHGRRQIARRFPQQEALRLRLQRSQQDRNARQRQDVRLPEGRRRLVLERQEDGQHQRPVLPRQIARPCRPASSSTRDRSALPPSTSRWSRTRHTEKVLIAKQGADYIAQRENEPALYGLDAKTVDDLTQAASDVKPAPPAKK